MLSNGWLSTLGAKISTVKAVALWGVGAGLYSWLPPASEVLNFYERSLDLVAKTGASIAALAGACLVVVKTMYYLQQYRMNKKAGKKSKKS